MIKGGKFFPKGASQGEPLPDLPIGIRPGAHFKNFIDCVRSRKQDQLNAEILEGHRSSTMCHLANISYRLGRSLKFDPATERFVGDEEANKLLKRKYRAPFVIPDKV